MAEKRKSKKKSLLLVVALMLVLALLIPFIDALIVVVVKGEVYLSLSPIQTAINLASNMYSLGILLLSCAIYFLILAIVVNGLKSSTIQNKIIETDEQGLNLADKPTHGSAKLLNTEEIKEKYSIVTEEQIAKHEFNEVVYGKMENGEYVGYKEIRTANRHMLIIGSSGRGKSTAGIIPMIIQKLFKGESVVVTDPSAEIYQHTASLAKTLGYDVKVLNLEDSNLSDCWNCLEETINPETERIDTDLVNQFAEALYQNLLDPDTKVDPYWSSGEKTVLTAAIGYTAWKVDLEKINSYIQLLESITGKKQLDLDKALKHEEISFVDVKNDILKAAKENHCNTELVQKTLNDIDTYHNKKFNYKQMHSYLEEFTNIEEGVWKEIPEWHIARKSYAAYSVSKNDGAKSSFIQGILVKLMTFASTATTELLSNEGIHIKDLNKPGNKCCYYLITQDTGATTNKPLCSLFFTMMFSVTQGQAKSYMKRNKNRVNPCTTVNVFLEEFYAIGVIGGTKEAFGKLLSNVRKYGLNIAVVVQSISSIRKVYDNDLLNIITGNAGTTLYFGCNDPDSWHWLSEQCGTMTVIDESHQVKEGVLGVTSAAETTLRTIGRPLISVEDARMWPENKVLVVRQSTQPVKLDTFYYENHPAFKAGLLKDTYIIEEYESMTARVKALHEEEAKKDYKTIISEDLKAIKNKQKETLGHRVSLSSSSDAMNNIMNYQKQQKAKKEKEEQKRQKVEAEKARRQAEREAEEAKLAEEGKESGKATIGSIAESRVTEIE